MFHSWGCGMHMADCKLPATPLSVSSSSPPLELQEKRFYLGRKDSSQTQGQKHWLSKSKAATAFFNVLFVL